MTDEIKIVLGTAVICTVFALISVLIG